MAREHLGESAKLNFPDEHGDDNEPGETLEIRINTGCITRWGILVL
jgi:hypothetical protein